MEVSSIIAGIGGVALLAGIFGGGIDVEKFKIPAISTQIRILSVIVGIVLLIIAIVLSHPNVGAGWIIGGSPVEVESREATVTRNEVNNWNFGETTTEISGKCAEDVHNRPIPFISYEAGDEIPKGYLILTDLSAGGKYHWSQFPVEAVCIDFSTGLFETTDSFIAPNGGSYWKIIP